MPDQSNYAICYEAILRVYRNAVVDYARNVLPQEHSNDWEDRLREAYERWSEMESNANRDMAVSFVGPPKDALDVLDVMHFTTLFEEFFDLFCPDQGGKSRDREREKRNWISKQEQIRTLRNSIAHPRREDLPYKDAYPGVIATEWILRRIDPSSADQIDRLSTALRNERKPSLRSRKSSEPKVPWSGKDAEALKRLRKAAGFTQKKMGEITGISGSRYSFIEYPARPQQPAMSVLSRIIDAIPGAHELFSHKLQT